MTNQTEQQERAELIRKLRRDCLWIPGKHYVTQLEEIMDEAAALLASEKTGGEPMFWVRLCSDGLYEGPIHNAQIERVRKESGAWTPLYTNPNPQPSALQDDVAKDAEKKLLTKDQIIAAARELNRRAAEACNIDEEDSWKIYGDGYIEDVHAAIDAAMLKEGKNV